MELTTRCAGSGVAVATITDARANWRPLSHIVCPACGELVGRYIDYRTIRIDPHDRALVAS